MAHEQESLAESGAVTIDVVREELQVGTRTVETGRGVRVVKTVREHPHQIDHVLRRDELEVHRVPIDKIVALADAPASRQEGNTLIIPILEEVLVTERRVRIKEELHIVRSERSERRTETVLLKSEEVAIERFGGPADASSS